MKDNMKKFYKEAIMAGWGIGMYKGNKTCSYPGSLKQGSTLLPANVKMA